jgi:hypothetical protein
MRPPLLYAVLLLTAVWASEEPSPVDQVPDVDSGGPVPPRVCSGHPRLVVVSPTQDGVYEIGPLTVAVEVDSCDPADFLVGLWSQGEFATLCSPERMVRWWVGPLFVWGVWKRAGPRGLASAFGSEGHGQSIVCMCVCAPVCACACACVCV